MFVTYLIWRYSPHVCDVFSLNVHCSNDYDQQGNHNVRGIKPTLYMVYLIYCAGIVFIMSNKN